MSSFRTSGSLKARNKKTTCLFTHHDIKNQKWPARFLSLFFTKHRGSDQDLVYLSPHMNVLTILRRKSHWIVTLLASSEVSFNTSDLLGLSATVLLVGTCKPTFHLTVHLKYREFNEGEDSSRRRWRPMAWHSYCNSPEYRWRFQLRLVISTLKLIASAVAIQLSTV